MSLTDHRLMAGSIAVVFALAGAGSAMAEATGHSAGQVPDAPAVAAPATPATPAVPAAVAEPVFTITVPTIEAENSSMSDDALKAVLRGDIASHAQELAVLNATSIRVPDLLITFSMQKQGSTGAVDVVYDYKNVDIEAVKAGVAGSVSVDGVDAKVAGGESSNNFDFKFGKMSISNFDIGGSLAFYGLIAGSSDGALKPLYTSLSFDGGSLTSASANCTIGPATAGSFSARPLKTSFADLMKLVSGPDFKSNNPPPEAISKLVLFYADFFSAVRSDPATLTSFNCSGSDENGKPIAFKMGPITVGGFGDDRYPAITAKNIAISAVDGSMSLDSATMKSIDLSGPIDLLEKAGVPLTEAWFTANARQLIPSFDGFAFSGLTLDVPDTENPGERIKATMADFDLSLSNYLGGIPMSISSVAHQLVVAVPPAVAGKPDSYDELRQLGISTLDLGYDLMLHRDVASNTVVIDKVGLSGAGLGSVLVAGTVGNVVDAFFSGDTDAAEAAAMALTLKSLKVDVVDGGLGDIIMKQSGVAQGMDLAKTRSSLSSTAQGLVLVGLSGNPAAKALGDAVGKFVAGSAKSLSVSLAAKDPNGLSVVDFAAAQDNPTVLADKVNIDATAQ